MAFQGSLEELPLPDVIQLVAASGKTGRFLMEGRLGNGQIVLREGQIVHAECGPLRGEEAFYELATWQEGSFRFEQVAEAAEASIEKSNTNLLMAAAQRIDEWKVLVSRVPSTRMVPVFREDGGKTPISLTPREWQVIRKIDESRSIDEISAELKLSPFDVSKTIYGLITSGLVELKDDLARLPFERLQRLAPEGLKALSEAIQEVASDMMGRDEATTDAGFRATVASMDGLGAVLDLIRSRERAIASSLGPHQAQAFVASIGRLIEER
jgi:DNA-binding MarR family transcriptional regulator